MHVYVCLCVCEYIYTCMCHHIHTPHTPTHPRACSSTYQIQCKVVVTILWSQEQQRHHGSIHRCYYTHVEHLGPKCAPHKCSQQGELCEEVYSVSRFLLGVYIGGMYRGGIYGGECIKGVCIGGGEE